MITLSITKLHINNITIILFILLIFTCFDSADIHEDMQTAQIQYLYNNIVITFQIKANYTEASFAIDTKDFNIRLFLSYLS